MNNKMMPENQVHLKNDCVDCFLQGYDEKTGLFTCHNHIISWYECVQCYQRQIRVERQNKKVKGIRK